MKFCPSHASETGASLLELCVIIILFSLLLSLGVPQFNRFLMREERNLVLERIETAIEYGREEAFRRNITITLCASANQMTCQNKDWSHGFLLFENPEGNAIHPPASAQILRVFPGVRYGKLSFHHFGQHLNLKPDGSTDNAGNFTYCPKDYDRREADAIIVNKACRTYRPIERNSFGILLKNAGTPEVTPLTCR